MILEGLKARPCRATLRYMRTVTHRQMRNNSGESLRAVAAGEPACSQRPLDIECSHEAVLCGFHQLQFPNRGGEFVPFGACGESAEGFGISRYLAMRYHSGIVDMWL